MSTPVGWELEKWAGQGQAGLGAHIKHQKERKFYTTIAKGAHAIELKWAQQSDWVWGAMDAPGATEPGT